ncbi:hypothetical protein NYR55_03495 [Sphingomonas sp. BGYR3]|uniref:NACHT domain-containing protein n=1 Tax=Sphingomonas sp. BGYR3 TaxID=2975483 RepID=UPI0021A7E4F7|nr:hypothetical protein [Sphingomonas sp. BGYR3]MDG5487689.1 hypothetical protein [Sphingomonas sp. BGYR3]
MSSDPDEFIPLDRSFHELAISDDGGDQAAVHRLLGREKAMRWPDLLVEARVILLSEAGSGKTEEIRHTTRQLRAKGKPAFFVRIEHVTQDFEASFEEGSLAEFEAWARSGEEGWLLLDSVDEARLGDPKDFERAIRKLGVKLRSVLQDAHIIITGRTNAWRPKTDLLLCKRELAYTPPARAITPGADDESESGFTTVEKPNSATRRDPFRIVALDDLHGDQVDRFATAKGVTDLKTFRTAIEKAEAWSFTTRPLDLAETIEFWLTHHRIGSRLELMRSSIAKRLEERDQDRSDARPITSEKILVGARLVAAAATLAQQSSIRVPDGHENASGLPIKEILTDWDDIDCATLLSRPIFDEGIYGTVRFHHRSVREYLTAEWLHTLIVDDASRAKIEGLFFRRQYGIEVIVPTMRPILPWLALLDGRILDRVVRLAPEVLFEGGDPSKLPLETRGTILRQTCEQLAQPAHGRSMMDYAAVQRFTDRDLADDIGKLLNQHADDDDIVWFLLRMVWQGDIKALANKAKHFALTARAKYTRIAAIRAVAALGSTADVIEVRTAFLSEPSPLRRDWIAEFLPTLPADSAGNSWLLAVIEAAAPKKRFETDILCDGLLALANEWPLDHLVDLNEGLYALLKREPVVERRHCEISEAYGWLGRTAAQIAVRLIEARHPAALSVTTLSILRMLPIAQDYNRDIFSDPRKDMPDLVRGWPELNHALFWRCVAEERTARNRANDERLIDYWHVSISGAYWGFDDADFDRFCVDIEQRELLDDRLLALTLAFQLYRQGGRPRAWRERLKRLAAVEPELQSTLAKLLNPPAQGRQSWRRQNAVWKRRAARQAERAAKQLQRAKEILATRTETLRDPGKPNLVTRDQYYLHHQLRSAENQHSRWTDGNWRSLIPVFGEDIATAFRDGAVRFWRTGRPKVRSEGAIANTTPFHAIFGLTGLEIEARETADWPSGVNAADAVTATHFALHELNGFPSWLPKLYGTYSTEVAEVVLGEIAYELATETPESESHYVLYYASWQGEWMWDLIAPQLLPALHAKRVNPRNLGYLLAIVQRSSVDDATIARIASQKAKAIRNLDFAPIWFATWVGVDPDAAIPALAARLAEIKDPADQTKLAVRFIVALLGGRSQEGRARQAYRTVEHMKTLYLLMHRYIREKDDIQRAGGGVYSPGPRDDAQDARNALFAFIKETPGKDAYLALLEMARAHPAEDSRPWMTFHARAKAAIDADIAAWTPGEVREFNDTLIRTPRNHRELWYLAIDRLEALKHDLEGGDSSIASLLQAVDQETEFRKFIGGWCRDRAGGRYNIPQEEELADAKRPDLRFLGVGFDAPVPTELKIADKWTGPHLFERLEIQLCGDYLRDVRSSRGIFALVYLGDKTYWELPDGGRAESFDDLVEALRAHWSQISNQFPEVEDIAVIGVDLTRRGVDTKARKATAAAKNATPAS